VPALIAALEAIPVGAAVEVIAATSLRYLVEGVAFPPASPQHHLAQLAAARRIWPRYALGELEALVATCLSRAYDILAPLPWPEQEAGLVLYSDGGCTPEACAAAWVLRRWYDHRRACLDARRAHCARPGAPGRIFSGRRRTHGRPERRTGSGGQRSCRPERLRRARRAGFSSKGPVAAVLETIRESAGGSQPRRAGPEHQLAEGQSCSGLSTQTMPKGVDRRHDLRTREWDAGPPENPAVRDVDVPLGQ